MNTQMVNQTELLKRQDNSTGPQNYSRVHGTGGDRLVQYSSSHGIAKGTESGAKKKVGILEKIVEGATTHNASHKRQVNRGIVRHSES